MPPGLLDMPEVVMTQIMEDTGIKEIMTLRKVCHDLRNFIDDVKPNVNLEEVWLLKWESSPISVRYQYPGGFHYVEYIEHEEGCMVKTNETAYGMEALLKNEDFHNVCMKDFEIVLGHQKSVLKDLNLMGRFRENMDVRIMQGLLRVLKSRDHPLKVEKLTTLSMDQNQIISILPVLDSNVLNTLDICFTEMRSAVGQLIKSDQWKNIKHVVFKSAIDLKYVQHFTHFSTADVSFKTTQYPDLVSLKNLFLEFSGFKHINIRPNITNINDIQRSIELLGEPIVEIDTDEETKHVWHYRIPITDQVLEISVENQNYLYNGMDFKLTRIEKSSVPLGAVIQN